MRAHADSLRARLGDPEPDAETTTEAAPPLAGSAPARELAESAEAGPERLLFLKLRVTGTPAGAGLEHDVVRAELRAAVARRLGDAAARERLVVVRLLDHWRFVTLPESWPSGGPTPLARCAARVVIVRAGGAGFGDFGADAIEGADGVASGDAVSGVTLEGLYAQRRARPCSARRSARRPSWSTPPLATLSVACAC